jgi:hypothetical protein
MKTILLPLGFAALIMGACKKEASEMHQSLATTQSNASTTVMDTVDIFTDYARTDTFAGIKEEWNQLSFTEIWLRDWWQVDGYAITRVVWTLHRSDGVQWKSVRQWTGARSVRRDISEVKKNSVKVVFERDWELFPCTSVSCIRTYFGIRLEVLSTGKRGSYMTADLDSLYLTRFGSPVYSHIILGSRQSKPGENQTVKFGYLPQ